MDIHCYGDSHTRFFGEANMVRWTEVKRRTDPRVFAHDLVAASAKGFANGAASRFAYKKVMALVAKADPHWMCFGFGQVDAEVGHYYRQAVSGASASAEASLAELYRAYVARVVEVTSGRVVVFKGPNPSTLIAQHYLERYVYARLTSRMGREADRERVAAALEKMSLTVARHGALNALAADVLRDTVRRAGYPYFDLRDRLEDPDRPGLCQMAFVPAEQDVHLADSLQIRAWHRQALFAAIGE